MSKKYLCIICRTPDIVWLDFLKTFTQYKLYIVIDDNSIDYKDKYKAYDTINIIQISNNQCKINGYIRLTYRFENEVTAWDKALYYFSKLNTSYDTIWFIEDDVFFQGEQTLLNIDTKYPNYDLLSNTIIEKEQQISSGNKWHWLVMKPLIPPPYYNCMCCAVRLSRDLVTKIKGYVDRYNTLLFHEIMFPTLCIQNKLIHNNPKELKNIVFRNNYSINDINSINLYHPVKNLTEHLEFRLYNRMPPRNMIFTSAGDNTDFVKLWCSKDKQNYDIYVYYYGKNSDNFTLYEQNVTHIERSSGSKFQNFYKFWNKYPEVINEYDRFFILDDDIEIRSNDINNMFNLSREYNLDICAPSFTHESKISHQVTKHRPNILLSYTNFVEVNTPLFSRDALNNLMKFYNPVLIGWGVDFLYIWANGKDKTSSYAIIHKIQCINPKDTSKRNTRRELELLPGCNNREKTWEIYAKSIGCSHNLPQLTYSSIKLNPYKN